MGISDVREIDCFGSRCFRDYTKPGDPHFVPADNEASRDFISDPPSCYRGSIRSRVAPVSSAYSRLSSQTYSIIS